jgi:hypothetical protein
MNCFDRLKAELSASLIERWRAQFHLPQLRKERAEIIEEVRFNTQQDLYVGEHFCGHVKSSGRSDRVFGKLAEILVVCVDDLNPGWLNVRARASEVHRENTKDAIRKE